MKFKVGDKVYAPRMRTGALVLSAGDTHLTTQLDSGTKWVFRHEELEPMGSQLKSNQEWADIWDEVAE